MADLYSNGNELENILRLLRSKAAGGGEQVYQLFGAYALTRARVPINLVDILHPQAAYMYIVDHSHGGGNLTPIDSIKFDIGEVIITNQYGEGYCYDTDYWYYRTSGGDIELTSEETNYLIIDFREAETVTEAQYWEFLRITSDSGAINRMYSAGYNYGYDSGYDAGYEVLNDITPILLQGENSGSIYGTSDYNVDEGYYVVNPFYSRSVFTNTRNPLTGKAYDINNDIAISITAISDEYYEVSVENRTSLGVTVLADVTIIVRIPGETSDRPKSSGRSISVPPNSSARGTITFDLRGDEQINGYSVDYNRVRFTLV